jgi:transposase InsO family protein
MTRDKKPQKSFFSCLERLKARLFPSYEDLLAEKEVLRQTIWHWQYPDGTYVPQEKRRRLFGEIARLNRKIKRHPNNPQNRGKPGAAAENPKAAPDPDQ